ncbi:endonuclease III domain-containing protein [Bifidobacterium aquikefiricola]|uniref:Endonuclease III domain-containing protein n=1 Tax=Bifidobacterium aquikefiricola TaxID=3059038 RepID=A0AB39U6Z6_9BIFI
MESKLFSLYQTLHERYGDAHWWPAKTPYEVMVGAILTQNTAWTNVDKALDNLRPDRLQPEIIARMPMDELCDAIRPAGFFNQKSKYLKAMTAWFARYDYDVETVRRHPLKQCRAELLATKGIGQETADSILLYAFDEPTFVVDAYTNRLFDRIPIKAGKNNREIKAFCESQLPASAELYNSFHALIVTNAKEHCRKRPLCDTCPLFTQCSKVGVLL